jgi:hypothetical protein
MRRIPAKDSTGGREDEACWLAGTAGARVRGRELMAPDLLASQIRRAVQTALAAGRVPEPARAVLACRWPTDPARAPSPEETGRVLGLAPETVHGIELRALAAVADEALARGPC